LKEGTIHGLTTVALLKVNYDRNVDHLDLYMPFVLDTLNAWPVNEFAAEDLAAQTLARHGLKIPFEAIRTILNRVRKQGHLRRDYGRYFVNPGKPIDVDLRPQREAIDREHIAVARKFIEFAAAHKVDIASAEDALSAILTFLELHEVAILVDTPSDRLTAAAEQQSTRESRTAALFIQGALSSDPPLAGYIQRMLEGLVLKNALLLANINLTKRQFTGLEVFFDTVFLFRVVGLASEPYVEAAREAIAVLRDANAGTSVFDITIDEMRRVLSAVERLIGTTSGVHQLRPTDLVRFLVSRRYRPSDVAEAAALLDRNIRQLGLVVRSVPAHIPRFTLDEVELAKVLMRGDQTDIDARVDHDMKAVAGVLTFRRGRVAYSLDNARAVFSTTSGLVVNNITAWYRGQQAHGVSPVIHQAGLSNIAWLKNPGAAATRLKRSELVALCAAALRPTPQIWKRFTDELRRLRDSQVLTSDEEVAVLTSRLTDMRLAEIGDLEDLDSDTVADIVERVREGFATEAEQVSHAREEELKSRLAAAESTARDYESAGRSADEMAQKSEEARRQLELRVIGKVDSIARGVGISCHAALAIAIGAGILLGLTGFSIVSSFWAKIAAGAFIVVFTLLNFVDLHLGLSAADLRRKLESYVERTLKAWWLG